MTEKETIEHLELVELSKRLNKKLKEIKKTEDGNVLIFEDDSEIPLVGKEMALEYDACSLCGTIDLDHPLYFKNEVFICKSCLEDAVHIMLKNNVPIDINLGYISQDILTNLLQAKKAED